MSRKKRSPAPAPKVWHPSWCACKGTGILSEPDGPRAHPNGETTYKHAARCPGVPRETQVNGRKDGKTAAAGEEAQ